MHWYSTGSYYFQDRIYGTGCSRLKLLYANIFCIVRSFPVRDLMSFLLSLAAQKFGAWSRVTSQWQSREQPPPPIPKTTSPPGWLISTRCAALDDLCLSQGWPWLPAHRLLLSLSREIHPISVELHQQSCSTSRTSLPRYPANTDRGQHSEILLL